MDSFRKHFPIVEHYAYLNNAGVAPLCRPAAQAIQDFTDESSTHGAARYKLIYDRCEAARRSFAELICASDSEVAMIANTSDGLSLVSNGIDWKPGDRVLIPEHEFPANVYPWLALEKRGVVVERIPYIDERCPPEQIAKYLQGARLLSVSAVSFANGFRFDLKSIGGLCRQNGVLFCVDAIQALGAHPLDVRDCDIDFLAADGHKWLTGPEGAGFFYIKSERLAEVTPSKIGWRNVKGDLQFSTINYVFKDHAGRYEEGSPNVPGLFGLGAAIDMLRAKGIPQIEARIRDLTDELVRELPKLGFKVRSPRGGTDGSGIVSFTGDSQDLQRMAELQAAGVVVAHRAGALRASPHAYNNDVDISRLLSALAANRPA